MTSGSCLCRSVTFEVSGDLTPPVACHCGQCRKQSGHYWCSTSAALESFAVTGADGLGWYQASPVAKRGFCTHCGSLLFWQHLAEDRISISMSAFDATTGLHLAKHIFVADKGDYYDITDDLPQQAQ